MKVKLLFLVFLTLWATNIAFGAIFNVTNPTQFQSALTIATSNGEDDIINVAAGNYNITTTLIYSTNNGDSGHKLTIQGAGAHQTILDGGYNVQIMYINTDADDNGGDVGGDITIRGIAFKNGNGGDGSGIYVRGSSINITIEDNTFLENSASDIFILNGGGAYAYSSSGSVIITNNTFLDNSADRGGGAYAYSSSGSVIITNNTFSWNSGYYGGGGTYVSSSSGSITITNNTFSLNYASYGGGTYVSSSSGSITITNNTFLENSGYYGGGGAYADSSYSVTITNNTFSENYASYGGGAYAYSSSGSITITNNTFLENSGYYGGGGTYADSSSGSITITNNTFSENYAYEEGGGILVSEYDDSAILNAYNNILYNNILYNTAGSGDDLYVDSDGNGNSIGSTVNLYNNDLSGNANFDTGQSKDLYITYTNNYHHANNIQKDPQFVDAVNGNFHLKPTSPCIDKGNNFAPGLPDIDFEGDPRIINGTVDIGADEYRNPVSGRPMPWLHLLLGE